MDVPPSERRAGPRQEAGSLKIAERSLTQRTDLRRLLARIDFAQPMRRRAVQEAISAALASTWLRRADMFEWARPRPQDFTGRATEAELAAADDRCAGVALACRNHALGLQAGWFE